MNILDISLRSISNKVKNKIQVTINKSNSAADWHQITGGLAKGKKIFVAPKLFHGWNDMIVGSYDDYIYEHAENFVNAEGEGRIFDIGAHFGYSSLCFASLKNTSVFAFEPNGTNFAALKVHIDSNEVDNIKTYNFALSDKTGTEQFTYSDNVHGSESSGSHLNKVTPPLEKKVYSKFKTETINTKLFDELNAEENLNPNILKIDVEGAEYNVLSGAKEWLADNSYSKMLLIEVHNILAMHDTLSLLYTNGFKTEVIDRSDASTSRCFIKAIKKA